MRNTFCLAAIILASITGCTRKAYYVSPLRSNALNYYSIPLASEQISSSTYISGGAGAGYAGDHIGDEFSSFHLDGYRTHQFGSFQGYYGATVNTGAYKVGSFHGRSLPYFSSFLDTATINAAGGKTYSSAGLHGGMNVVAPFGRGHEWRLGFHTSYQQEFGSYLRFRRKLPIDSVDGVVKRNTLGSLSFRTELAFRVPDGQFSIQMELGALLGKDYRDAHFGAGSHGGRYAFWAWTLHRSFGKMGFYLQAGIGTQAAYGNAGVHYRLQARRKGE